MLGTRTVRRSLRACAPSFVQPLSSRDEDNIKILECHVDGYPKPDIRWEKNGKAVGKSRRIHMVRSGDKCLLQIRMPQEDDFGHYSCIASNIVGMTSTHIRLGRKSLQSAKYSRSSSPQTLKPISVAGSRSRSMDGSRDFVEENKTLCSKRSRSRSTSRNSKQDVSTSTKSKLSSFTNNILKRNEVHNCQKHEPKKHELSKSMDDCRKVCKGFFDKMKIPDIFVHRDDTHLVNGSVKNIDVVLPIISVSVTSKNHSEEIKVNGNVSPLLFNRRPLKCESFKDKSPESNVPRNESFKGKSPKSQSFNDKSLKNESFKDKSPKNELFKDKSPKNELFKNKPPQTDSVNEESPESESFKNSSFKNVPPENAQIKNAFPRSESLKNEILKNKDLKETQGKETESNVQNKSRSKFSSYLKIFDSTNSVVKLKRSKIEGGGSLRIIKKEKEAASCDQLETEGFLARFMRRKSYGSERKSSDPTENSNFVSHISQDSLNNTEKLQDIKCGNKNTDINDSANVSLDSDLKNKNLDQINNSHVCVDSQNVPVPSNVTEFCSISNYDTENDVSSEECAKKEFNENTEVIETKDNCLSESTNSHSTEESTAIELTPLIENAEVFDTQKFIPNEETRKVPSINIEEIPENEVYEISKETDEAFSINEQKATAQSSVEDSGISIDKQCEGTISQYNKTMLLCCSYSKPLDDEKCEDLLESATQRESLESDFQRVSSPVESPARIIKGPQSVTVLRGESVTLALSFTGEPIPSVIWMKGGRVLRCSEDGRLSILEGREMSVVTVNEVTADDSGKYVVCVENEGGGDSRFVSVAVVGFPEPPGGEPTASEFTDHSLVLSWYGSMYDGGSVVTGYQVEMCTLPDTKWHKVTSPVNTSCSVQGLSMGQRYMFRVRAENRYGVSHPSKESKVICLNDFLQYDTSSDEEPEDVPENAVTVENGTLFAERFDLKEEVGKGRFGTVYRCVDLSCGRARAAKVIRCLKMKDKEKVRQEIEIMSRLHHPKLMQVLAAFESGKNMIMIMEFISGGELFERVIADDFVLTEHDCILFMRQICDGVAYMHNNNILHLDLKPENILCKTRTSHKIKIIDFGLAREYNSGDNLRILFGTPEFVAPEVLNYEPVSQASDMWSVGVVCYVLISGLSPFMGDNDTETFANITRAEMDFDDDAFDEISQDAKDFISRLLVKKIKGRMSAEECLQHPWLATARLVQKRPLSTEKLKRFIIRRKWQKSGTAIRALGRMVSLSRSSLGSSCDSYSPIGSPTSSRSRTSLASRSETADSGDSEVFSR